MTIYLIIDAFQTISMTLAMALTIRNILINDCLEKFNKAVIAIPIAGVIQIVFASAGISIIDKKLFNQIYDTITGAYILVEMTILLILYYQFLQTKKWAFIVYSILISIIILYIYLLNIKDENSTNISNYFSIIESIYFISLCLWVYINLIFDDTKKDLLEEPFFYFNTGVFVLFSTTLPLYSLRAIIENRMSTYFIQYSTINFAAYVAFYLLLNKFINTWKPIRE